MSHLHCRKLYSQINAVTDSSGYITENVKYVLQDSSKTLIKMNHFIII